VRLSWNSSTFAKFLLHSARIGTSGCRSAVEYQIAFLLQLFAIPTTPNRIQKLIVITTIKTIRSAFHVSIPRWWSDVSCNENFFINLYYYVFMFLCTYNIIYTYKVLKVSKNKPIVHQTNTDLYLSQTSSVLHCSNDTRFNVFTVYCLYSLYILYTIINK